jgi:hypothetical protein
MSRAIIELHCQRIPKKPFKPGDPSTTEPSTAYNGVLVLKSEPGSSPSQYLNLVFEGRELQDVAVWVHYLLRLLSVAGVAYCVRMFQKAPNAVRPPVAMDLRPDQVQQIYESPEKAQLFFAPRFRERVMKQGESFQDVIEEEIDVATRK